jgi:uncharacterized protein (DUF433 family)
MNKQYVEQREGGYWISGLRGSLESVVFAIQEGISPETIASEHFPVLTLEQVNGAITYYLSHREEIDSYLRQIETDFQNFQQATRDPKFSRKLVQAHRDIQPAQS